MGAIRANQLNVFSDYQQASAEEKSRIDHGRAAKIVACKAHDHKGKGPFERIARERSLCGAFVLVGMRFLGESEP